MGVGTVIASAIAITLLVITAYVLIGGTLATAKMSVLAQRDISEEENQRIHTEVKIMNASANTVEAEAFIELKNTGTEIVHDFNHTEVYLLQGTTPYTYTNLSVPFNFVYRIIPPDTVHPGLLDPDEVMNITVPYDAAKGDPSWVKVTTANGVYDSAYLVP